MAKITKNSINMGVALACPCNQNLLQAITDLGFDSLPIKSLIDQLVGLYDSVNGAGRQPIIQQLLTAFKPVCEKLLADNPSLGKNSDHVIIIYRDNLLTQDDPDLPNTLAGGYMLGVD